MSMVCPIYPVRSKRGRAFWYYTKHRLRPAERKPAEAIAFKDPLFCGPLRLPGRSRAEQRRRQRETHKSHYEEARIGNRSCFLTVP